MEGNRSLIQKGAKLVYADPWAFLDLIDHAEYVFTNSFHGSVFSVLFDKTFTVLNRPHSNKIKQTSRIDTLLDMVELQSYYYSNGDLFHPPLFSNKKRIEEKRQESLSYLSRSLELGGVNE